MFDLFFILFIVFYIIFLLIFSVYYFKKCFEIIKLKDKIFTLTESYNSLSNSYDNLREFKHDFANILQSINGYIYSNNLDGLKKYYSSLLTDYNLSFSSKSCNNSIINSPPVMALIYEKQNKACLYGIKFNIEINFDFNDLSIDIYEFSRILGIFLDNSIEAAKNCNDKIINIKIKKDIQEHKDIILIENTYTDQKIDTKKIFENNYTSKPGNSGIGLFKVRKILKKYGNVILNTTVDNGIFKQTMEIYK